MLVVIGIALMRRLEGAPAGGRNGWARAAAVVTAVGIAAYLLYHLLPDEDDPSNALLGPGYVLLFLMIAIGVGGPFVAILGLGNVRYSGERRLAVAAFVASLVLPGIFVANVVACAVTDACFH